LANPQHTAQNELNSFDALILNAASRTVKLRKFDEWNEEDGAKYLRSDIDGNLWMLRQVLPGMRKRKFGRMVFISSLSAAQGTSRFPYYCLAKSAIEGLFLNLAVDYGEDNIFCNKI